MVVVPKAVVNGFNSFKDLCLKYGWEAVTVVSIPTSAYLAYLFKTEWILDPYSNRKGIASAVVINTGVFCCGHFIFQRVWAQYWEAKEKGRKKETMAQAEVRKAQEEVNKARKVVEEAHQAITTITLDFENATQGKQLAANKSEENYQKKEENKQKAVSNKRKFLDEILLPILEGLDVSELTLRNLENELQKTEGGSRFVGSRVVRQEDENLNPLIRFLKVVLRKENIKFTNAVNILRVELQKNDMSLGQVLNDLKNELIRDGIKLDDIVARLESEIKKHNANLDEINLFIEDLKNEKHQKIKTRIRTLTTQNLEEQIAKDEREIARIELSLGQEREALAGNRLKITRQQTQLERLKEDLAAKTLLKKSLSGQLNTQEMDRAEKNFERLDIQYHQFDQAIKLLESGSSNFNINVAINNFNINSIKLIDLKKLWKKLVEFEDEAGEEYISSLCALDKAYNDMVEFANAFQAEAFSNLSFWKVKEPDLKVKEPDKKSEIQKKYENALNVSNNRDENVGRFLNLSKAEEDEIKSRRNAKIKKYYSEIYTRVELCQPQGIHSLPAALPGVSSYTGRTVTLAIPDWIEGDSTLERQKEDFFRQLDRIIKQDLFYNHIANLLVCLKKEKMTEDDLVTIISQLSIDTLMTRDPTFGEKLIALKNAIENYQKVLAKKNKFIGQEKEVRDEIKRRENEKARLVREKDNISDPRLKSKNEYDNLKETFLEIQGQIARLEDQTKEIQNDVKDLEIKNDEIALQITSSEQSVKDKAKQIADLKDKVAIDKVKIKTKDINLGILKIIDAIMNGLLISYDNNSLLDEFKVRQKQLNDAEKELTDALEELKKKRQALKTNSKELEDQKNKALKLQEEQVKLLQNYEEQLAEKEVALAEAERDDLRWEMFLKIEKKWEVAQAYFEEKKERLKATSEGALDVQRSSVRIADARFMLALKKQEINIKKAKLGRGDSTHADTLKLIDEARYQIRIIQLKRLKIEQEWRANPKSGEGLRRKIMELLREEENYIYQLYSNKAKLKDRAEKPDVYIRECGIKALYSLLDVLSMQVYTCFIRVKHEKSLENSNIILMILDLILFHQKRLDKDNTIQKDLSHELKKSLEELKEAIERDKEVRDEQTNQTRLNPPTLGNFCNKMKDLTSFCLKIKSYKIPLIEARLELVRHLSKKPYEDEERFEGKFQDYQKERDSYRFDKFKQRENLEVLLKSYITNKSFFDRYNKIRQKALEKSLQSRAESIAQTRFFEKTIYLLPTTFLIVMHEIGLANKVASLFGGVLSTNASRIVLCIMSMVHLYLQSNFPKIYIEEKENKLDPGILANQEGTPQVSLPMPNPAVAKQGPPIVSVVPAVQQQP